MMISMHQDGSLYDESSDVFHQPPRQADAGLYLDLDKNLKGDELNLDNQKLYRSHQSLLTTPDTQRLSLSTPDVTTLLTSTVGSAQITSQAPTLASPFPRRGGVTAEQEMYAQGFLEALDQIGSRQPIASAHAGVDLKSVGISSLTNSRMNGHVSRSVIHHANNISPYVSASQSASGPNPSLEAVAPSYVTATMDFIPNINPSQPEPTTAYNTTSVQNFVTPSSYNTPIMNHYNVTPAAAMDPSAYSAAFSSAGSTIGSAQPGLPLTNGDGVIPPAHMMKELHRVVPADMKTQEHMKVERKKARNRIAASKCRLRRLQRESDLQGKVRILKEHNQELNNEVSGLRSQINNLKKALIQHMKGGCQVTLPEGYGLRTDSVSSE